jgi:hypothetical protein
MNAFDDFFQFFGSFVAIVFGIFLIRAGWNKNPLATVFGISLWALGWIFYWKTGSDLIGISLTGIGLSVCCLAAAFQFPKFFFRCRTS